MLNHKLAVFLLSFLTTTFIHAVQVQFLCPNGVPMREGTFCVPNSSCKPVGLFFDVDSGEHFIKDIAANGMLELDDSFIGHVIRVHSWGNNWRPLYCDGFSGHFDREFVLDNNAIVTMHNF